MWEKHVNYKNYRRSRLDLLQAEAEVVLLYEPVARQGEPLGVEGLQAGVAADGELGPQGWKMGAKLSFPQCTAKY